MTPARAGPLAAALAVAALAAGCGKTETPKVDAAAERAAATERAKQDAFGTQVKAHEQAKALADDMNRKAQGGLDAADRMSK
jgi:hypothetical protein